MRAIQGTHKNLARQSMRTNCSTKIQSTRQADGRLTALGAKIEAERCLLCVDAPCAKACPADTKPDKFLRQLHFENPLGAAETILDNNPLGGICGTVCPVTKLCEGACTRKNVDSPVKIGAIQRYLHDFGVEQKLTLPPVPLPTGHKVAVIGAGPAGLAAARELARRGSAVTVYERRAKAGGALNHTLSPLRVSHSLVAEEIQRIRDMGVTFVFNTQITDTTLLVQQQGFDAVFVSPGLQGSRLVAFKQKSEYWQKEGVISALSFLESANSLDPKTATSMSSNKTVVIVGGGSVAMDCAITAKSLGATQVHVVCRESLLQLPADEDEIRLVREIGGVFHPEAEVSEVSETNRVSLTGYGANNTGFHANIEAHTVIVAAGQLLDDNGKQLLIDNKEEFHAATQTNEGIVVLKKFKTSAASSGADTSGDKKSPSVTHFTSAEAAAAAAAAAEKTIIAAGGDAVRGGGDTVVQAVADGKHFAAQLLPHIAVEARAPLVSLRTEFVGLSFENPFCLSSSPVTNSAEMIARAYDAGFAGSYYKTLNREDKFTIYHPSPRLASVHNTSYSYTSYNNNGNNTLLGIQNMEQISDRPLADNLKDIEWLRVHYPTKITGVSIMGYCDEDWAYLAKAAEGAGAHLLELNFSCPQMARKDAGHHVGQQLDLIQRYTAAAKRALSGSSNIPVIAKLTPNITDMVPAALAAQQGGADAISAINTVKSISHIDLHSGPNNNNNTNNNNYNNSDYYGPLPNIGGHSAVSGFSGKACRPIGLRFVSELSRSADLKIPISGMGGIYTWQDAAEYLSVGASNLQVTTSVMQHGVRVVEDMIDGLQRHLHSRRLTSVHALVGHANRYITEPGQLQTATEVVSVIDYDKCIGCGVCVLACRDGAAQAITLQQQQQQKTVAVVDRQACVGCKMCQFVCPVGAISFETRPRIERARFSK